MIQLRPYQQQWVESIRAEFKAGKRRVLGQLPTGGGKTVCFSYIAKGAMQRGNKVWILAHRVELVDQISASLRDFDVPHGYVAANYPERRQASVHVASVQTLVRRLADTAAPDLIIVDEAHQITNEAFNALLKTLEEPPGDMKFVLATGAAHQLLPTIRSRCLGHAMLWPDAPSALAWMQATGDGLDLAEARVLLRAAGGRPDNALDFVRQGRDARQWAALPKAVARGDVTPFKDWTSADIVDAMHKLCHDMLALRVGASPRFFAAGDLPGTGSVAALTQWGKALSLAARTVEHPFNAGLMAEALVSEAKNVLNSRP